MKEGEMKRLGNTNGFKQITVHLKRPENYRELPQNSFVTLPVGENIIVLEKENRMQYVRCLTSRGIVWIWREYIKELT